MDKHAIIDGLRDAFRSSTDPEPQRGAHCLAPEALAAFLDGSSSRREHGAREAHLADCAFCLHQLAQICRSREDEGVTNIHPELLQQAEALGVKEAGEQQPGIRRVRRLLLTGRFPALAALAATVVLATGIVWMNFRAGNPASPEPEEFQTTRFAQTSAINPRVLAPTAGSLIVPAEQVFRWTEVPGSLFYDVRLLDPDGEVLLRERVKTTRWLIPDKLHLKAGGEYYVRVDAYLDDEQFLSSEHVVFGVRSDP